MPFNYRVQVLPGQLSHLPKAVGPETGWLEAASLRQAKRAVQGIVHVLAQSLGRTTDTSGAWTLDRGPHRRSDLHRFDLYYSATVDIKIIGEVIRKPTTLDRHA